LLLALLLLRIHCSTTDLGEPARLKIHELLSLLLMSQKNPQAANL